jgi:hypothetical protein
VQSSPAWPEDPGNLVLDAAADLDRFAELVAKMDREGVNVTLTFHPLNGLTAVTGVDVKSSENCSEGAFDEWALLNGEKNGSG